MLLGDSGLSFGGSSRDGGVLDPEVDAGAEEPVEDDSSNVDAEVDEHEKDVLPGSENLRGTA